METIQLEEKKKILEFISKLSEVAKEKQWVSHYDTDSDSLAVRNPSLTADVTKHYITKEFAFYLGDKSHVEGIFIEYFISNFVSHHKKDFKPIAKDLRNRAKKEGIIELPKKETQKLVPELESILVTSLINNCTLLNVCR